MSNGVFFFFPPLFGGFPQVSRFQSLEIRPAVPFPFTNKMGVAQVLLFMSRGFSNRRGYEVSVLFLVTSFLIANPIDLKALHSFLPPPPCFFFFFVPNNKSTSP